MRDLYSTKRKKISRHFISEKKNLSGVKKTNSKQHKHVTHSDEVTGQTSEGKEWLINQLSDYRSLSLSYEYLPALIRIIRTSSTITTNSPLFMLRFNWRIIKIKLLSFITIQVGF